MRSWIAVVMIVGVAQPLLSQKPAVKAEADADIASDSARKELPLWDVFLDDEEQPLTRTEKPVLRWSNPAAGRVHGDVHLFLRDGRPEAAVCVYRYFSPYRSLTAECVSLCESRLKAVRDKQVVWTPQPGAAFSPIPQAPPPAAERVDRLRQMRTLARGFSVELTDFRNSPTGDSQTLRLLTQPIYRYESAKASVVDGALFAFVVGTDPEALLAIEARSKGGEAARWEFAVSRMNIDPLRAKFGQKEVWQVSRTLNFTDPLATYLPLALPKPE